MNEERVVIAVAIALPVLALVPPLLPGRRGYYGGFALLLAAFMVAPVLALRWFESIAAVEGPEFFGVILYFWFVDTVLVGAFLTRLVLAAVLLRRTHATRLRCCWTLCAISGLIACCAIHAIATATPWRPAVWLIGTSSLWMAALAALMTRPAYRTLGPTV